MSNPRPRQLVPMILAKSRKDCGCPCVGEQAAMVCPHCPLLSQRTAFTTEMEIATRGGGREALIREDTTEEWFERDSNGKLVRCSSTTQGIAQWVPRGRAW